MSGVLTPLLPQQQQQQPCQGEQPPQYQPHLAHPAQPWYPPQQQHHYLPQQHYHEYPQRHLGYPQQWEFAGGAGAPAGKFFNIDGTKINIYVPSWVRDLDSQKEPTLKAISL